MTITGFRNFSHSTHAEAVIKRFIAEHISIYGKLGRTIAISSYVMQFVSALNQIMDARSYIEEFGLSVDEDKWLAFGGCSTGVRWHSHLLENLPEYLDAFILEGLPESPPGLTRTIDAYVSYHVSKEWIDRTYGDDTIGAWDAIAGAATAAVSIARKEGVDPRHIGLAVLVGLSEPRLSDAPGIAIANT